MKIKTTRFGEIEIDENLIFDFVEPIIGFENLNKFAIVDHAPESPFKWLQSLENMDIAFPITVPGFFGLDYQFTIPEEDAKKINATAATQVLIINIVRIPQGKPKDATINLAAPIVINSESKQAMQLVLVNETFPVQQRLFPKEKQSEQVQV